MKNLSEREVKIEAIIKVLGESYGFILVPQSYGFSLVPRHNEKYTRKIAEEILDKIDAVAVRQLEEM